jgi:hypothetical protein
MAFADLILASVFGDVCAVAPPAINPAATNNAARKLFTRVTSNGE